jgi:RNA polymerase sigma-70 factor (ECF subfamily)
LAEDGDISFNEIKHGHETAFRKIYEDYYTRLCFYAGKFVHDPEQARSLVQEIFVKLWVKRENLNVTYSIKAYLFNSVRNRCIDYLRKEKSNQEALAGLIQEDSVSTDHMEVAELNARINSAIQALPDKCREIFVLCRFEGLKYTEIAGRLSISVKTVEMQMGIALKKLRNSLSDYQWINLMMIIFFKK